MPRLTGAVKFLLIANVAIYIFQLVAAGVLHTHWVEATFGLSPEGAMHGRIWQFGTYMFLHDPMTILHILMNMLGLFFMGPDVERTIGSGRFLLLYLGSGIIGGAGWVLLAMKSGALCVGASGAVFGVLGAYGALFPRRPVTVLLFFVLPMTMTARFLAAAYGLMSLAMLLNSVDGGIAHAAHLAGGLAGYIYAARLARNPAMDRYGYGYPVGDAADRPGWLRRLRDRLAAARQRRDQPDEGEVDRILEKVAERGLNSLTRRERDTLDRASRMR